ncbi:collagen binding domain-containing protein, partial [Lysinibacillus sp. GbtcB16]|uniref:collagen binding domain-containing protein n=1 Tax=Lysinibacillus sp. GbtcB16 TaxID=2824761 RepID=UPI001C2F5B51
FVTDSLRVYPVTFAASGDEELGSPLSDTAYTVTSQTAAGKNGFKLQFLKDVSSAYKIVYKTKASSPVLNNGPITNTVTSGSGG